MCCARLVVATGVGVKGKLGVFPKSLKGSVIFVCGFFEIKEEERKLCIILSCCDATISFSVNRDQMFEI